MTSTDTPAAVRIEFGKVGDSRPIPDLTLNEPNPDAFNRAVTEHAIPHLRPVLAAMGRPELADCMFVPTCGRTAGYFLWLDLAGGEGARFCGVRITPAAVCPPEPHAGVPADTDARSAR